MNAAQLSTPQLPTLVNFHIPRTGGRSRTEFLARLAGNTGIFRTIGENKREHSEYLAMPDEEKRALRLISGHMPFTFLQSVIAPCFRITFFRNPLYRAISHYNGFKSWHDHPIGYAINAENIPLGNFLLMGVRDDIYDNVMVRYFLENPPPFMEVGEQHLQEAIRNLDAYIDFIGITEFIGESLERLCRVLGVAIPGDIPHVGNLHQERGLADLSARDKDALYKTNIYDLRFFDYALETFKRQHIPEKTV